MLDRAILILMEQAGADAVESLNPVVLRINGVKRQATKAELDAAAAVLAQADVNKVEADMARDDAKRALSALDTIIAGIDGATLAQAKTAIKQLAQIQKHIILATLGR